MRLQIHLMHFLSLVDTNIQVCFLYFNHAYADNKNDFKKLQFQQWLGFDMIHGSKWAIYWIRDTIILLSWSGMKFSLLVEGEPSKSQIFFNQVV